MTKLYGRPLDEDGHIEFRKDSPGCPACPAKERVVAGSHMSMSLDEFTRACEVLIEDEATKPLPNNAVTRILCESVRLARENEQLGTQPIAICAAKDAALDEEEHDPDNCPCEACLLDRAQRERWDKEARKDAALAVADEMRDFMDDLDPTWDEPHAIVARYRAERERTR